MSDQSIQLRSLLTTNNSQHSLDPSGDQFEPSTSSSDEPGRPNNQSVDQSFIQLANQTLLLPLQPPLSFETADSSASSSYSQSFNQSFNQSPGHRSASFTRNRPPPLKLVTSAKRFNVSTPQPVNQTINPAALLPPEQQRFTDDGSFNQTFNQSLLDQSINPHHLTRYDQPINHSVYQTIDIDREEAYRRFIALNRRRAVSSSIGHNLSLIALIVNQILSVVAIAFASMWAHFDGVIIGCLSFLAGVGFCWLWWRQSLMSKKPAVKFFLRPMLILFRVELVACLLLLILLHALHVDPSTSHFPNACADRSNYPCVRLDANQSTSSLQLQLPMLRSSLSMVRDAMVDHFQGRAGYTVLSADSYTESSSQSISHSVNHSYQVIGVHVRVLNTIFGIPSDLYVKLTCSESTRTTVVALHSENRVMLPDYGLNVRHIDQVLQFVRHVDLGPEVSCHGTVD